MSVNTNETIADFSIAATSNQTFTLSAHQGSYLVLYFYPKDSTPGCTLEGQDFRDHYPDFEQLNCKVFGISRDSLKAHENFKAKQNFPFELLSDSDETLCTLFDVIKQKNMYGKLVRGIERSTFLIDPQGVLVKEWRGVKVKNHVDEVLSSLSQLQA